jgi:hypothetical protein
VAEGREGSEMKFSVYCAWAGFFAAIYVAPVTARAQDASCSCATAYQGPSTSVGTVVSSVGDVMVLQPAGYVDAAQGSELSLGNRIVTGARSSAAVKVGQGCRLELAENSSLDISRAGNNICVKVLREETSTSVLTHQGAFAQQGPNGTRIITPATLFGALAIGAGILSATNDGDAVSD